MTRTIQIHRPDDMHVHFRQGDRMRAVVPFTARQFGRAMVMPNTKPYISTVSDALRYREEILAAVPEGIDFQPLMTLYLQKSTNREIIYKANKLGIVHGIKFYPQGATTNSEGGVSGLREVAEQLRIMEDFDMPLLVHGESADPRVDVFMRESAFYEDTFRWLINTFPKLRVVFEHITTRASVEMILKAPSHARIGATITPQHLLVNRNYMLGGLLRPHAFCKPILKEEDDRIALLKAATSGDPRFFLGTDSAPHPVIGNQGGAKEVDCGCAGCFTAHAAIELYAEAFDSVGKLARLDEFASRFGSEFYELPRNEGIVTLSEEPWNTGASYGFGRDDNGNAEHVVPFRQEVPLKWKLISG